MLNLTTMSSSNAPAPTPADRAAADLAAAFAQQHPQSSGTFDDLSSDDKRRWAQKYAHSVHQRNIAARVRAQGALQTAAAAKKVAAAAAAAQDDAINAAAAEAVAATNKAAALAKRPKKKTAAQRATEQATLMVAAERTEHALVLNEKRKRITELEALNEQLEADQKEKRMRIGDLEAQVKQMMNQQTLLCQSVVSATASLPPWSGAQQNM